MTLDADIDRIVLLSTHDLGAARQAYEEEFGFPHDHPSIDTELKRRFEQAYRSKAKNVPTPLHLVLALLLRKGKRGRLPVAKYVRRGDVLVIKEAQQLADKLVAAGAQATDALLEASDVTAETDKRARSLSAEQIYFALRHGGKTDRG